MSDDTVTWYIAECSECWGMKMPFYSAADRDEWADAHESVHLAIFRYEEER